MVMKKLLKNPISMVGLVILLGFILVAIFAPWIAPTPERYKGDPYRFPVMVGRRIQHLPSEEHPMGLTLRTVRSILWTGMKFTQNSLKVGLIVTSISCLTGIIIGSVSVYWGRFDEVLMRFVDVFMSFLFGRCYCAYYHSRTGLDKIMLAAILFRWTGSPLNSR